MIHNKLEKIPFITFIIPTIGRDSLLETIDSLINLHDSDWNAIIIFDGIKNKFTHKNIYDNKIKIIEIEKTGNELMKNSAGCVRNIGIEMAQSFWIGFVDDDDTLSKNYICYLKNELMYVNNDIDAIIFRMMYKNGAVLPSKFDRNIIRNKVGISFAIKKDLSCKYKFDNNPFEDYFFLKNIQNNGHKILISSYVAYYVRCSEDEEKDQNNLFPKILIN
jgi:hypothetical protein